MDFSRGIHNQTIFSDVLNETINFQYYIPKNYSELNKYSVYYTFDSQDFFKYGQLELLYERMYKNNEIERAIIVGIPYPSVEWRKYYFQPEGSHTNQFMEFVAEELTPYVDTHFSTLNTNNNRLVMGESLAGSFSLKLAIHYPHIFKNVTAFSPEISDDFFEEILETPGIEKINLYHTIGLEEGDFTTILGEQANFLTPNRNIHEELIGVPNDYIYKELDGTHIWKTWKPQLQKVLTYFFGK